MVNMGIWIDKVTVFCEAECCDNKKDVLLSDGNLNNYYSNYSDPIDDLKSDIADAIFPWEIDGKKVGFNHDVLCNKCVSEIVGIRSDINKLENKLSNFEG